MKVTRIYINSALLGSLGISCRVDGIRSWLLGKTDISKRPFKGRFHANSNNNFPLGPEGYNQNSY